MKSFKHEHLLISIYTCPFNIHHYFNDVIIRRYRPHYSKYKDWEYIFKLTGKTPDNVGLKCSLM